MRKRKRSFHAETEQPLSAGRVEYLEQARQRIRSRKIRRAAIVIVLLAAVIAFATGMVGESIARAKDLVDSISIALAPDSGWPQNLGTSDIAQVEPVSGGFVALGAESCVVYSDKGNRLNYIQSGYARPALAAGKTRFVLYNRSGNELRVESRTQNLYTKTMDNSIYLCAVADDGQLAVVTDDVRSAAKLIVYSSSMDQNLSWELTSEEGIPLRMAFSPDSRDLAVAAVTASGGQMTTNLYVLAAQGDPITVGTQSGTPQRMEWISNNTLLVLYDNRAVLYYAGGGERASWDYSSRSLVSASIDADSGTALLFSAGQTCEAVLLDKNLNVQFDGSVSAAQSIVRNGDAFYLLTDSSVECFDISGNYQWSQDLSARPQVLLAGDKQLLVFSGNTAQVAQAPEQSGEG